jgi:hypothetical protein
MRSGAAVSPSRNPGLEVADHPAVTAGGGVMELIDHDVAEPAGRKPVQISGERLDAGEQHPGIRLPLPAVVQAEVRIRLDAAEHIEGLAQNLLTVRDEQHAAELRPGGVERGEPRLSEPGRHHDQATAKALQPGLLQGRQRLPLHGPRGGRRGRRFGHHTCGVHGRRPAPAVVRKQAAGERLAARVGPQPSEGGQQGRGPAGADGPLDAARDTRCAEVAAAHEHRRDRAISGGEEVGLRMKTGRA